MDLVLVLAAAIVGVLVVFLLVRRWRWRQAPMAFLRAYRASPALQEYAQLRRRYLAGPGVAADQTYGYAADAVVAELGPGFDPRVPAWSRLGSLEPDLKAFIGRRFDLSAEEPMDLEAFAEALLLARHMQPLLDSPDAWWTGAAGIGLAFAADWRVSKSDRDAGARSYTRDQAFEEAELVMDRFFQSGDWYWDFEHGVAIDSQGQPFSEQAAAPLTSPTGAANADQGAIDPGISPSSEGGSPGPVLERDVFRAVAAGTVLTPSEGAASTDGEALAPELGSSWRWTASGPTPSPRSRRSPSASLRAGDGEFQTRADPTLQLDALAQLLQHIALASTMSEMDVPEQRPMRDCEDAYVASIAQMHAAAWPGEPLPAEFATAGTWFERWTLDCGDDRLRFAVAFMPAAEGGTILSATLIE